MNRAPEDSGVSKTDPGQSFFGHLDELSARLLRSLIAVIAGALITSPFSDRLMAYLIRPVGEVVFTSPADAFTARLILVVLTGAVLALPWITYEIWSFVCVGLKPAEQRAVRIFGPLSLMCFLAGVIFAYTVVIPFSLRFLLQFATPEIRPMITITRYVNFLATMLIAFGVLFELPLVLMFLTRIGVATPEFLKQKRRHAVVLILILSAVITPPDVVTLAMMAGPLILLYELGVMFSRMSDPTRKGSTRRE